MKLKIKFIIFSLFCVSFGFGAEGDYYLSRLNGVGLLELKAVTPSLSSLVGWTGDLNQPVSITIGTGVATALGTNIGSSGSFITLGGAAGTPSSLTLTNATGLPISGIIGLGTLASQNGTFSGTSSGINTGDQTNIIGNAGTATALQTARNINGVPFDGTTNITVPSAISTLTGGGNHKIIYLNGSGVPTELALGSSGQYLKSNGATSAPSFDTPSGGGGSAVDVTVIVNKNGTNQTLGNGGYATVSFSNEVSDPEGDFNSNALTVSSGEVWIYTGATTAPGLNTGNSQNIALYKDGSLYRILNVIGHWSAGAITMNFHTILTEAGDYTLRTTTQLSTDQTVSGNITETYLIGRRLK